LLKFQGKIIETTLVSRLLTVDVTENGSKLSTILPMRCLITRNMDITLSGGNTHLEPKHQKKINKLERNHYHIICISCLQLNGSQERTKKKTEFKSACFFQFLHLRKRKNNNDLFVKGCRFQFELDFVISIET
jgi:hypothetical protein